MARPVSGEAHSYPHGISTVNGGITRVLVADHKGQVDQKEESAVEESQWIC